jgi:hypothetical protein
MLYALILSSVLIIGSLSAGCKNVSISGYEFPIDYCTNAADNATLGSYKYTCNTAGDMVVTTYYDQHGCIGNSYNETIDSLDSFNCMGPMCTNIARVTISISPSCMASSTTYGSTAYVTNECKQTNGGMSQMLTCMNGNLTSMTYTTSSCAQDPSMTTTINYNMQCITFDDDTSFYYQITCNSVDDTVTTTTMASTTTTMSSGTTTTVSSGTTTTEGGESIAHVNDHICYSIVFVIISLSFFFF